MIVKFYYKDAVSFQDQSTKNNFKIQFGKSLSDLLKINFTDIEIRLFHIIDGKGYENVDAILVVENLKINADKSPRIIANSLKAILNELLRSYAVNFSEIKIEVKINAKDSILSAETEGADQVTYHNNDKSEELDYEKRSKNYVAVDPAYSFERVILPVKVKENLLEAINVITYERIVFDTWGLSEIQPHPSCSLNLYGKSGTGKTMAAEAIANKLGKKILKVSYADVESKYHGEGPKMIKAIFLAATNQDAVLFFDEADSLLSKRLTNVTQGSEQAINSMRSQLLICLEDFKGMVIFATNLVVNYDQAFLTRLRSVEFSEPDAETRKKIWDVHLRPVNDGKEHKLNIPLGEDVDTEFLANNYRFVGRDIRQVVISACVLAAMNQKNIVSQDDFIKACEKKSAEINSVNNAKDHTVSKSISANAQNELKNALISSYKDNKKRIKLAENANEVSADEK